MSEDLTHFSAEGRARMVDVSAKPATARMAIASGVLRMQAATLARIHEGRVVKGNVLAVADVAAVMAAKRTPETIPMCHSLPLTGVEVAFTDVPADADGQPGVRACVAVNCFGPTGVEMEALCAVSAALLTIYDMCKAIDPEMRVEGIQLDEKHGGKHGVWRRSGGNA
ncbi:MAG: molybdenum cofactor biosynthesis protein C [Candidatus Dactylopiibacterium carminicum]|uniref:cyclic pyranopterin monophosphate synthase MoaC n=1 Tax=Candidatus Dactylopiibacterium carminicum TaxID=857335 RepID=UPI000BD0FA71|nr:cyclic pyranopterin monophosphate synthase MoaC [Candidatus Dactylopiibacterium carminicum]PAT00283.1 MAG: molybdenum cofactor biosynthesis protein C [Candidatus Dactylopiibacterium carminicum]